MYVGGDRLSGMSDKRLTSCAGTRSASFPAQFTCCDADRGGDITLPLASPAEAGPAWFDAVVSAVNLADRLRNPDDRAVGRPAAAGGLRRALITRPAVVFADEPTGNLDSRSSAEVLGFLRRSVTELGQTVVMVTHEPSAAAYADRVLFLADGRIVDEMRSPTADSVLDRMKGLEPGHETMYTPVGA